MNNCNVKLTFFDPVEDLSDLTYTIGKEYRRLKGLSAVNRAPFSTSAYYSALLAVLKSESTPYIVEYSTDFTEAQKRNYKQSIVNLKDAILNSIPDLFKKDIKMSELKSLLDNQLQQDLNAGRLKIEDNTDNGEFSIERVEVEDESSMPKEVTFRQYLNDTYGTCFGAIKQMKNSFARDIFTYSIVDFDKGRYITNSIELNENIATYKSRLFDTVVLFLQSKNPSTQYSNTMYLPSQFVSSNYSVVMALMEEHINNSDIINTINNHFAAILSGVTSLELDAINAYTTLKYFDSLLQETLGKTISFKPVYKNQEVGIATYKYEFKKDSGHHGKNWSDSENRSAAQNTARFSKFVLDSIPLIINGKVLDRNVGVMQFNVTLSKLFSGISELRKNLNADVKLLVSYVRQFHNSPIFFASKIHQLISENLLVLSALRTSIGFNDIDVGTVQSIYKYLLSYDDNLVELKSWDKVTKKSIRAIEFNTLRTSYNLGKYSILSDLVGVMDDCMDATYFYTRYNFNGSVETLKRVKHKSRRGSEKFKDSLNAANSQYQLSYRELLKSGCQVRFISPSSTQNAIVRVPLNISDHLDVLEFLVNSTGTVGILEQSNTVRINVSNKPEILQRVYTLFSKDTPINLSSVEQRKRLLSSDDNLSDDEKLFKAVLRFIDDRLKTKFLNDMDGLDKLNIYHTLLVNNSDEPYISDLLLYSVKSQVVSDLYYDFEEERKKNPGVVRRIDFTKFLKRKYRAFSNLSPEQKVTYFRTVDGQDILLTLPSSTQWVDVYDYATLVLQGDAASSVSKNQSGNNDANYVTAFLGGQIHNLTYNASIESIRRAKLQAQGVLIPQVASSALLFTKHPLAIKQVVINSDVANRHGDVKNIRDLKLSELFYNAIIHNFWTSFITTGEYCIQPTTYSDKVKLIQYLVDGKDYKHFNKKSLSQLSVDEIIDYYAESIGESSRLAMDNIVYTYSQLWREQLTLELINSRLKNYTESKLIEEAAEKGIDLQLDFHYRVKKSGGRSFLSVNEVIPYQARYADKAVLREKLQVEKLKFINNLVDSGVQFYTEYHDTSLHDKEYLKLEIKEQLTKSNSPVAKIILDLYLTNEQLYEYMNKWVKGGKLIFAYDADGNPITYLNTDSISEINPLLEKYFYLDSLLSNNLRFQLTGFETNHPDKSKFQKMWKAKVRGINNLLLNNTITPNKDGEIKADFNINRLQNSKIIWAHPGTGKTFLYSKGYLHVIDFDSEFKFPAVRQWCEEVGILYSSDVDALRKYKLYLKDKGLKELYNTLLTELFNVAVLLSLELNRKLLVSDLSLLNDNLIDLILTISENEFKRRSEQRGELYNPEWKADIDNLLSTLKDKTIDIGNLYMSDVVALSDGIDLYALSLSNNKQLREVSNELAEVVQNISQGTLLKRNVIVPATMHYMHGDFINGVSKNIKVAIIKDIGAKVFNFDGNTSVIDSMDGSAFINAFESILENMTLGSQEVGADKKPIWHHYNQDSATAALMKFATFEINNARMKASLGSEVPLYRMFKKMTNMQWANLDLNGDIIKDADGNESWNTSNPIVLGLTTKLTSMRRVQQNLNFSSDILEGNPLYYKVYEDNGEIHYKQITDFGKDENGYYTVELYVDELGDQDFSMSLEEEKVYHYFDSSSNHYTTKQDGMHNINSLYELWEALGGMESQSLDGEGFLLDSEASNYTVVGFMNKTIFPKEGTTDRMDLTQNSYSQPLKDMMIGYLTNNSAMKNGAVNRNSEDRWFDDKPLAHMTMDSRNLGIQMDADHDVEEAAEMTEFSQVISALESGGALHKYSKQVYYDLGKVAAISSQIELDTLSKYLAGEELNYNEVKSQLYDLIGRTLLNGIKSREDQASLTDDILRQIEKRFNRNVDHLSDTIKIPLSDPNIYSLIIPTIASIINKKSIKRKYPGSGCVMIPGYNIMQYYSLGGNRYMFTDLVQMASQWMLDNSISIPENISGNRRQKYMVDLYLTEQQKNKDLIRTTVDEFIPTDIVDIMNGDLVLATINLDGLKEYYNFKDRNWSALIKSKSLKDDSGKPVVIDPTSITHFRYNIRKPKNLAPVRITFQLDDGSNKSMNVFDLDVFRNAFQLYDAEDGQLRPANTEAVLKVFRQLKNDYVVIDGKEIPIKNLKNMPAELIISNMYSKVFGTGSKSIAQIRSEGSRAFLKTYRVNNPSNNYDIIFDGTDSTYITFNSPRGMAGNKYIPYKKSNLYSEKDKNGNINVYLLSDDNRKQFKVGRYIVRPEYSYVDGEYRDLNNKVIPSKNTTNFKREGSIVYEYVEFVSQYKVTEKLKTPDGGIADVGSYDKYYINIHNISSVFNRDNSEASKKQYKQFIVGLLDDIYSTKLFEGITLNSELSLSSAGNIVKYVTNMQNVDNDFRLKVLIPIETLIRTKLKELSDLNISKGTINIADQLGQYYQSYYNDLAVHKYNSWEQSLYFTAARIPAQTLQSFMLMKAIAYTGNTSNLVFVSHWQAWLLGSKI